MSQMQVDVFNYEHAGRAGADYIGNGGPCDPAGLARVMAVGDPPDILVMPEGDRYELNGREGAWEAATELAEVTGRPYVPHTCSLPDEGGMFAPTIFHDPTTIQVRRFYDHRLPDFAARTRNLLVATRPGQDWGDRFFVIAHHGDHVDPAERFRQAKKFSRYAQNIPCLIAGDWNGTPSGPQFEWQDLHTPGVHTPIALAWRIRWDPQNPGGPHEPDTDQLDFLVGSWTPEGRIGGLDFSHAAEVADDYTPTQAPRPNKRQQVVLDGFVFNQRWRKHKRLVDYKVHPPLEDHPSDHYRVSAVFED
jgi:endonuclease/exonuclease/phosphatase family metal-dependent hydrolase